MEPRLHACQRKDDTETQEGGVKERKPPNQTDVNSHITLENQACREYKMNQKKRRKIFHIKTTAPENTNCYYYNEPKKKPNSI